MWEIMQEADLFDGVSEQIVKEIAEEGEEMGFEEGAVIFEEGDIYRHVYELIEGSVDLIIMKKEIVHLTVSRAGQIFGWSALVQPYLRTATAKCTAPTRIIRMSRYSIEKVEEKHPREGLAIMKNLTRIMARRLKDAYAYILLKSEGL